MAIIRILHLSNILVDAKTGIAADILQGLMSKAKRFRSNRKLVYDYIVVCGNITADGTEASFNEARHLLENLAENLLVREDGEVRLSRLVVVPGRRDVIEHHMPEQRYARFNHFYNQLFSHEIASGRMPNFDWKRAMLRELKDLTFISTCFWNHDDSDQALSCMKYLLEVLNKAEDQATNLDYMRFTPTILISAESPLFDVRLHSLQAYHDLQTVFKKSDIELLHLFGSGATSMLPREPFGFDMISFGTGPRNAPDSWPFQANVLELKNFAAALVNKHQDPKMRSWSLRFWHQHSRWESSSHISGELDPFFVSPKSPAPCNSVFSNFMEQIEDEIIQKGTRFIVVRGFPGSGKSRLFAHLSQTKSVGSRKSKMRIFARHMPAYDPERIHNMMEELRREIKHSQKSISKRAMRDKICLVLYDSNFLHSLHQDKSRLPELLERNLVDFYDTLKCDAVIYILAAVDFTMEYEPIRNFTRKLILPHVEETAMDCVIRQYSCSIPIKKADVSQITGSYLGFSHLLLEAAKTRFAHHPGSTPVNEQFSTSLVREALLSGDLVSEASFYLQCFETVNLGPEIRAYIQRKLEQSENAVNDHNKQIGKLVIDAQDLEREIVQHNPDFDKNLDIIGTLERLKELGYLREATSNPEHYELCSIVPFLTHQASKQLARASQAAVPSTLSPTSRTERVLPTPLITTKGLRKAMVKVFNSEEMQVVLSDIAAELEKDEAYSHVEIPKDFAALRGNNLEQKLHELIEDFRRKGLLPLLVNHVQRLRPDISLS